MKARVLKNGRIVNIYPKEAADCAGRLKYIEKGKGLSYYEDELDFIDYSEQPDYWKKLKHQYAGMAMQGIMNNNDLLTALCDGNKEVPICKIVLDNADIIATALVNRLKEEEL